MPGGLGRQLVDQPDRRHRQRGERHRDGRENRDPLPQQREEGDRQPVEHAGEDDDPQERRVACTAFEIRYVLRDPGRGITRNGHARGQAQHRIQDEDDDLPRCRVGRRHDERFSFGWTERRAARHAGRFRQRAGCGRLPRLATTARRLPLCHPRPKLGRFGSYVHPGTR